jgi:hypothetical protein
MDAPSRLASEQGNARPKEGNENQQSPSERRPRPYPIFSDPVHGDYSCEAHHLISGNQAMKNEPIEEWLCKSKGKIVKDTGYSINNSDNGVWLPSIPDKYKSGEWGSKKYDEKYEIAKKAMDSNKGQFHKGPHDITDPEDPFGKYHISYKDYLKKELQKLHDRIRLWASGCFLCEKIDMENGPFKPNYKLHNMLDRLSDKVKDDLTDAPSSWSYFISKIAMDFHKKGHCTHNKENY